jgi:2-methylisocitrate lyase-like PEP mutase family enzyme
MPRPQPSPDGIAARRAAFRRLHESGCFVLPNPWDVGTARYLQHLGFPALATTSGGFAFREGLPDTGGEAMSVDLVLDHVAEIVGATDLPVNADFQSGYAADPDGVAANVARCAATGAAGVSIEDLPDGPGTALYPLDEAVARVRAARAALDGAPGSDGQVLLTARTEAYLMGVDDPLATALERLPAFAEAGADVLYAPGVTAPDEIRAIVGAVAPKPVNLLVGGDIGFTVDDVAALGVRRVSVGSGLNRQAWGGFARAATALAEKGSFAAFASDGISYAELNGLFGGG